ncbi:alkaline phosphatase family protein [Moellerella wisconsensis]|uniref:Nucleotide pyrophosphatase n=1 Tax=Moellerella wisconsensis ATCC 35017 TaxID=1354267 RepID=A0A0N0Z8V7_9GAMM|nr:alkaline phosphatase family protein [Moellerella wisconsensis]KPD03719.1 hypothetical protein M992_0854 [Moellerella wisconsensis ATCC 35017]VFS50420.1 Type I phosphodiesterase / nucleotide pyrophosphatase [Moellerella wisconsensis]
MATKVILVILDGLNYQVAHDCMGYLQGLTESGHATLYSMNSELPSMSRPLYECILTGIPPVISGIVNNNIVRLSTAESIFSLARKANKVTAAAAYYWVSELYNSAPYQPQRDRFTLNSHHPIQYGYFYHTDHYPDDHLLIDAENLRQRFDPDFLLIHPMNIDDSGHKYGLDSAQYRNTARRTDSILSHYLPTWREQGYQILITSDHGMNNDCSHGGVLPEERQVPLWVIGSAFSHQPDLRVPQTALCGSICHLLAIEYANKSICKALLKGTK